ncbi:MAG: hypothetical protein FJ146_08210 [Deltaproteobacteria bacterium]|nr:hypothetical protein [Deltaproteobacteria bacterium]
MVRITLSICHTISNIQREYKKACTFGCILAGWLILSLAAPFGLAASLPVSIAWDVPLENGETYDLEIADSPGFAMIQLRTIVRSSGFSWAAPREGVYHWRLMRRGVQSSVSDRVEVSALASGSFAVIDPGLERVKPAKISWDPVRGSDRYKVYLQENALTPRIMTLDSASMVIPTSKNVIVLEVVPFFKEVRTTRNYQLTPSLTLDSGLPPLPTPPSPLPAPVVSAPPTRLLTTYEPQETALSRRLLTTVSGIVVREDLKFQKLAMTVDSSVQQFGGGASFWVNPNRGLILSGALRYHEHQNSRDVRISANLGTESQRIDQSRFVGDLSIGYNLLDFLGIERVILAFSGTGAVTQLPYVEKTFVASPDSQITLFKDRYGLVGAGVSAGYIGTDLSFMFETGGTVENAHDGRYNFARAQLEAYPSPGWALVLAVFGQMQQGGVCSADPAQCLFYGRSTTESLERGVALGVAKTDLH